MKRTALYKSLSLGLVSGLVILSACVEKPTLDTKKAELADAKQKLIEYTDKVKKLESEIASLDTGKTVNELKTLTVSTKTLEPQSFAHFIELQGSIKAENNVQVTAKMGGVVTRVYVKEGQSVKAGQVLAETDNSTLLTGLKEAETQLALAKTVYEKQASLWEQKIGSELQYLNAKTNKEAMEDRIASLKANLAMTRITAPISGVVETIRVKEGEMAAPGFGAFQVVNNNELKATAKVADTYISKVTEGKKVNIYLPDAGQTIEATISFVGKTVDPLSRTFLIEANLKGAGALVHPNMISVLRINDVTLEKVLVVDQNLIQNTERGKILFTTTTKGNKLVAQENIVETGLSYNGQVEIVSGLSAGQDLITAGSADVVNQQAVKVMNLTASK